MPITAGELNQRVTILAPVKARSKLGGETTEQHSPLRDVWARVVEGLGKEFVAAGAVVEQKKAAFKLRWAADLVALGATLRVAWGGHAYEIVTTTGTQQAGELWLHGQSVGKYP